MRRATLALATIACLAAGRADSVIIDSGDGTGNTSAPAPDPGWENVGFRGGLNGVYVGYGWVLTAAHVGEGPIGIEGVTYPAVPGSTRWILHSGATYADLVAFRIHPYPHALPALAIPTSSAAVGAQVRMIGWGKSRGAATSWQGHGGWLWGALTQKRWGTNRVGAVIGGGPETNLTDLSLGGYTTQSLVADFDEAAPNDEAVVALGDSGGGFFVLDGSTWKLGGITYALGIYSGQPASTSLYGNVSYASDLSHYRDQILAAVRPCADGVDNDSDGLVDYPADPDCTWIGDLSETPDCVNGLDDDADGSIDLADPDCSGPDGQREAPDTDADGVPDAEDDCILVADFAQLDSDQDGYGNACDFDYDDNGAVGISDYATLSKAFGTTSASPGWNPELDSNGDGAVGITEFGALGSAFGQPPGPSGLACAGTPPCP